MTQTCQLKKNWLGVPTNTEEYVRCELSKLKSATGTSAPDSASMSTDASAVVDQLRRRVNELTPKVETLERDTVTTSDLQSATTVLQTKINNVKAHADSNLTKAYERAESKLTEGKRYTVGKLNGVVADFETTLARVDARTGTTNYFPNNIKIGTTTITKDEAKNLQLLASGGNFELRNNHGGKTGCAYSKDTNRHVVVGESGACQANKESAHHHRFHLHFNNVIQTPI